MPLTIDQLKDAVAKLPPRAFEKFAAWVYREGEKRDYAAQADDSTGIPHRDVLRAFKRELPMSRGHPNIQEAEMGGGCMATSPRSSSPPTCASTSDLSGDTNADMDEQRPGSDGGGRVVR